MDGLIDIPEESWVRGGTPDESRTVPWGVQSIGYEDIDFWQGRLEADLVEAAVRALVDELQSGLGSAKPQVKERANACQSKTTRTVTASIYTTRRCSSRMNESGNDEFDPTASEQREIGREMVDQSTGLGSMMAHAYRGEVDRVGTWRQRLDQTTTWAVTVMAAILTWAFSSPDNPHYILLVGIVVVTTFLGIEARRYRDYDVFRSRTRLLQENLFANALDPSQGVELHDWRAKLSTDYRTPTLKVSFQEALANRVRRVYLPLLGVLLVAWVFRITAFSPRQDWLAAAGIARIPGVAVVAVVGIFYVTLLGVAFWPRERHAKGEFREGDPDEWKETDR